VAEQGVDRRFLARIERQIRVFDVPCDQPRALERAPDPLGDRSDQDGKLIGAGGRHEQELEIRPVTGMDAVEAEHVEVDVEVERGAEALDQHDRARPGPRVRQAGPAGSGGRRWPGRRC